MDSMVRSLIEAGDRETLERMAREGRFTDVPAPVKEGWAFLAARLGKAEMLRFLTERCHGGFAEKDGEGRNLLHAAAASGNRATMEYALRVLGLEATAGDVRGITPLDLAAEAGAKALENLESLCGIRLADCYRNPVIRGFRPDPSILRVGEDYYAINSTFAMMPALPISHSRDLVHWETVGHVFTDPEVARVRDKKGGYGYWAPDLSWHHGRFWVVATLRAEEPPVRTQMITSAPAVTGPWETPRFLEIDGIDPSLFEDGDGRMYMLTNPGAQLTPLSEAGEIAGETRMIWAGWNRHKSEGPHLLRKDGWYYLFLAEGGTGLGHMESCARSRNLYGPYDPCPFNPILGERDSEAWIRRGGHGKPVQLPDGRWAMAYLCGRQVEGRTLMGRETAVDPMEWTAEGWPMVNRLRGPSCLQRKLLPDAPAEAAEPWVCPRLTPESFLAEDGEGSFRIPGGAKLSELRDARLLLHRLREAEVRLEAEADVSGMEDGSEAGLAGYYDENSYFLLAIRKCGEGAEAVLRQRAGGEDRDETVESLGRVAGNRAALRVSGRGLTFTVSCAETGETRSFRAEYLTDEGLRTGKRYTGAAVGMAAVGKGYAVFRHYLEEM